MKKLALAISVSVIALTGAFSVPAHAQAPGVAVEFNIAPEQRTRIRTYVKEQKVRTVKLKERKVGYVIPEDVELEAVPADWGPEYTRYRYVYDNDRVVLVEPSTRRVVYVID